MFLQFTVVRSDIAIVGMLTAMTRPDLNPSSGLHVFESSGVHVLIKQANKQRNKQTNI